ncbi:MAG: FliH/SctL family protein [Sphingomonas sp.]
MDQSFHIKPFAFDRVFSIARGSGGAPEQHDGERIIALTAEVDLLRSMLETNVAVARAEGFEAGLAHARGEVNTAILAATDALHSSIEAVENEFEAVEQRTSRAAAEVAMAAAEGLAARALETDPTCAIDEAIGRVLTQVSRGQELQIRVHPDLLEATEGLINGRQSRERRRLSLLAIADPSLAVGDALISWEQGGLALNAEARRTAILSELGLDVPAATGSAADQA